MQLLRGILGFLLVLVLATHQINAATHVNISIAQHAATANSETEDTAAFANNESAEDSKSARLQLANDNAVRSARVQLAPPSSSGRNIHFAYGQQQQQQQQQHHQNFNAQSQSPQQQQQQQFSRLRKAQNQKKQNQAFERYIQNYHSGPTVETVFESSSPAPARYQNSAVTSSKSSSSSSSADASPQRIVAIGSRPASRQMHFERQVVLPSSQARQDYTQNTQTQVKPITEKVQENSASSTPASSSSGTAATTGSSNHDQFNFDNSYANNHNFDQGNYNFDDQSDLTQEYPPSFDESGYYDNAEDDSSAHLPHHQGYLPPHQPSYHHQRPVVTKTIQIAQPALKAKKYEVRHPAIQKEFYDIEERVVIKPAGTIVVELERPVAKIPKGEAILPLGIPHPAVAGAYNNNGLSVAQTQSHTVPAQASSSNNQHPSQYHSGPVHNVKSTVASAVTTMPSYDHNEQSDFVDSKLRKPYSNADAQQSTVSTTERAYVKEQPQSVEKPEDFYVITDGQGNQRQINNKHLTPKMFIPQARDDVDPPTYHRQQAARVEVNNNGEPNAYNNANQQSNFNNGGNQYQTAQYNDNNSNEKAAKSDDYFDAEYVDQDNRQPQDTKPARLQEQPAKNFDNEPQKPMVTTHIIKHEHNIHIPPSQHNIYLGHQQQKPRMHAGTSSYKDEAARVLEIKPTNHAQRHRAPVFLYSATTSRPLNIRHNNIAESGQYRVQAEPKNVQYSAPYSQMRYNPQESERYVQEKEENHSVKEQSHPQTHIQIQIPQHPEESDKPIVVSSTISPMTSRSHKTSAKYRVPSDARSSSFNGEVETFSPAQENYGQLKADMPDCDHSRHRQQEHFSRIIELPANSGTTASPSTASGSGSATGGLSTSITSSSSSSSSSSTSSSSGSQQHAPSSSGSAAAPPSMATTNVGELGSEFTMPMGGVDINLKSNHGHINTGGSRVIAATPAPTDASASSESFHKRRIVVNHPFQTVREVVEHEPITNYHHVQVNEPALSPYYQMHDSLRQYDDAQIVYPGHNNFQYAYQQHHV